MDKQAKKPKVRPKSLIREITKDHVEDIKSIVSTFAPRVCVTREEDEDLIGCYAIFKANSANDKLDKTLKECWSAIAFLYSTLQIYNFAARETLDFAKVVTIAEEYKKDVNTRIKQYVKDKDAAKISDKLRESFKDEAKEWADLSTKEMKIWERTVLQNKTILDKLKEKSRKVSRSMAVICPIDENEDLNNIPPRSPRPQIVQNRSDITRQRLRQGRWAKDEIKDLINLVWKHGKRWETIRKERWDGVRQAVALQGKWRNLCDMANNPNKKIRLEENRLDEESKEILMKGYEKHGS